MVSSLPVGPEPPHSDERRQPAEVAGGADVAGGAEVSGGADVAGGADVDTETLGVATAEDVCGFGDWVDWFLVGASKLTRSRPRMAVRM